LVRRPLIGLLYQRRRIDDDECGAVGEMRTGRGNRSTRRKHAPVPLCPPQIPYDLMWARTRKPATNRLSYYMALYYIGFFVVFLSPSTTAFFQTIPTMYHIYLLTYHPTLYNPTLKATLNNLRKKYWLKKLLSVE
jgi:hypothetical protein